MAKSAVENVWRKAENGWRKWRISAGYCENLPIENTNESGYRRKLKISNENS